MSAHSFELSNVGFVRSLRDGDQTSVLDGIDQTFGPGSHLVFGETAGGKSTLIHILGGLSRPTSGEVLCEGDPISRYVSVHRDIWRRKVGIVLQRPVFFSKFDVAENISLALSGRMGVGHREPTGIDEIVERLNLGSCSKQRPGELSGGQRQRLALAMATVGRPRYLLLDEPTAHQDSKHAQIVLDLLERFWAEGAVVVIATHDERLLSDVRFLRKLELSGGQLRQV